MIRWAITAASIALAIGVSIAYLAFPNTETVTVTKRVAVDPYANAIFAGEDTYEIKKGWNQYCALYESHVGVSEGSVEPAEGQYVLLKCEARKAGLKG